MRWQQAPPAARWLRTAASWTLVSSVVALLAFALLDVLFMLSPRAFGPATYGGTVPGLRSGGHDLYQWEFAVVMGCFWWWAVTLPVGLLLHLAAELARRPMRSWIVW